MIPQARIAHIAELVTALEQARLRTFPAVGRPQFRVGDIVRNVKTDEVGEVAEPKDPVEASRVPVRYEGDETIWHTLARKLEAV